MHCPRCGQQQVSNETKFCSRCGFQLALVAEVLANNGFLPQLNELYSKKQSLFTKKNGVIFTVVWFIFFVMMLPAFAGIADAEEVAGVSAVWGIFSTIMLLIVSLGVLPSSKKPFAMPQMDVAPPPTLYGNVAGQQAALPPQQHTQTAQEYAAPHGAWRTPTTGELTVPGSVTDPTTKLLKKDQ